MKKGLIITATALLLFAGCTEDKKEAKEQIASKQEVVQTVEKKEQEVKAEPKTQEAKVEEPKIDEKKIEPKIDEAKAENNTASVDELSGEVLFKTCASWHGLKGEKEALGKYQAITGWDKNRVIKALNGYKDGSYGGVMKSAMKPHVVSKTPEQIDALADFISKL